MASFIDLVPVLLVCLASPSLTTSENHLTNYPTVKDTQLVFAFMVHRHGDRTPIETLLALAEKSINITEVEELIAPYGYGQLTDVGKRTGYKCGEFIRRRYNDLISPKYNKSEIYIRSTDSTRTKMTSLTAMSAVFPASVDNWSRRINWDPIPYTTVPAKYDYNEAEVNCPTFTSAYNAAKTSSSERLLPFTELIQKVSNIIDYDITSSSALISSVYDVYVSLRSLGYELSDSITDLMDEMREAAGVSWDITTGNDAFIHLQAGPLLNEFFTYANETIAGNDTQKVRIYPAHDINVYSFESVTKITPRQGAPKYASLYSLELRKVIKTGQYVVLPVYLDDPNVGVEKYLQVEGCSGDFLCDYYEFLSLTSQYALDESTWRSECGFTDDLEVDTSSID